MIELLNIDCMEYMRVLEDNIFDLTVTSPPYDNLRNYNGNNDGWTESFWMLVIKELYRVTKVGGVVVWVVGDATIKGSETGTSFKQALFAMECGFNLHDTMIYQKDNPPPVGGSNRYYSHFEFMFVFSKGPPSIFNPIKAKRRNKWNDKRTERYKGFVRDKNGEFSKKKVSLTGDVKIGNIFKYVVGGGNSVEYGVKHPAAFPQKLAVDHVLSWSNKDSIVFDPFMGSGTTAIACLLEGRSFVGCELDEDYFKATQSRFDDQTRQKAMF